jgi:hypothetical protein
LVAFTSSEEENVVPDIIGPGALVGFGLIAVVAAIVASGGKIGSWELPIVATVRRQALLGGLGLLCIFVAAGWVVRNERDNVFRVKTPELSLEPREIIDGCPETTTVTVTLTTTGETGGVVAFQVVWGNDHGGDDFSEFGASPMQTETFKSSGSHAVNVHLAPRTGFSYGWSVFVKVHSPQRKNSDPERVGCA